MAANGTPWFKVFSQTRSHPKIEDVADSLGIPVPHAVGYLTCLWCWVTDFAPDGDLSKFTVAKIERGAMWDGTPGAFVDAITSADLMDEDRKVHNWEMYCESYNRAKKQARKRKQSKPDKTTTRTGTVPVQSRYSTDNVPTLYPTRTDSVPTLYPTRTDSVPTLYPTRTLERRGEERRGDDLAKTQNPENETRTPDVISMRSAIELMGTSRGFPPLTGRTATDVNRVIPCTPAEIDQALDATIANAANPGWSYWAKCVETLRKKPPDKPRDMKHGYAEPSKTFNENAKL
jgi:hypothetical protein